MNDPGTETGFKTAERAVVSCGCKRKGVRDVIAEHVLYRKYGEYLYVLNLNTAKSYVFDGIAPDLIGLLDAPGAPEAGALAAYIEDRYDVPEPGALREEIGAFLDGLRRAGIIACDTD